MRIVLRIQWKDFFELLRDYRVIESDKIKLFEKIVTGPKMGPVTWNWTQSLVCIDLRIQCK